MEVQEKLTERDLVIMFKEAKEKKARKENSLEYAIKELEIITSRLIEYLESKSATATASYEGVGYAQINKPKLYATCNKENIEKLIALLKSLSRDDMIKTGVSPQSLSTFVSECIDNGKQVPEYISYYLKPNVRLY